MKRPWYPFYPETVPYEIDVLDCSIYDLFERAVQKYPNNQAIIDGEDVLTYTELKDAVDYFAAALHHRGFQKGERIAIMLPNCKEYAIATYAIHRLGGILVQVNPLYTAEELKHILKDSESKWLISRGNQHVKVRAIGLEEKVTLISTDGPVEEEKSLYGWIDEKRGRLPTLTIRSKEDIAVLQYTGGTTGRPKGGMLTHANIVSNFQQNIASYGGVYEEGKEIALGITPVFHAMGMTNLNITIFMGSTYVPIERFEINELLQVIRKHRPTSFGGSPTIYIALLRHPNLQADDLTSFKICSCGSAPMPVEVIKEFEEKSSARIIEAYGLTEGTTAVTRNPMDGTRKVGSIGIPLPSTDVKIVDLATGKTELPFDEPGELIVKGPQVMKGYWKNPEETELTLRDGWLYTGDIATMDEDGYLYIVGRKKDMIIASGYNIYPSEIEEVLYAHPAISEAVVYGIPHTYRGETVKAAIVLKQGKHATEEEITEWCAERLAKYKYPRVIEFREALPKTAVGKILRRALIEEDRLKLANQ